MIALTRAVSPTLADCELTHVERRPLDVALAVRQHATYESVLSTLGLEVVRLPGLPECPDSVFVEDTLVALDEVVVIARPGVPSRRTETDGLADAVVRWLPFVRIEAPATLDGGDVLRVGRVLYVGLSARTNGAGAGALRRIAEPLGYDVRSVPVERCLHLKSAVTALDETTVLLNPAWVDPGIFGDFRIVEVDPAEPHAANVLAVAGRVILPLAHEVTGRRLRDRGYETRPVDLSELAKAEGGVTCCSVLLRPQTSRRAS